MTDSPVLLDVTDGVATITLNRPEAMNSLSVATKEALLGRGARASRRTPRCAASCSPAPAGRSASGRTSRSTSRSWRAAPARRCSAPSTSTTTRSSRRSRRCPSRWSPPSTASPPEPGPASPSRATCGSSPTRPASTSPSPGSRSPATPGSSWTLPRLVGTRQGARAALLPADHRRRRVARARSGDPGRARRASSPTTVGELAARLAAGPTVAYGGDPSVGGLLRRTRLRGVAGLRELDDAAHRRHR